jgi:DNA (cytosine-5)-methyltransferase 1
MTRVISLFAGPGGVDQGARLLGIRVHGWDLDADACSTAEAAGFGRTLGSVTDIDPESMRGVTGAVITPPCPTWSSAGRRTGVDDMPHVLDAIERLAEPGGPDGTDIYDLVQDARSGLVVEAARIALRLPHLQWLVCEQVPAVAPVWEMVAVEMAITAGFAHCYVLTVRAEDLGVASRRTRTFLIATRHHAPVLDGLPFVAGWRTGRFTAPEFVAPQRAAGFVAPSMAAALGWPVGERVNTRGQRRTSGGNEFSADTVSWCLTEKARSWSRVSDGARLTPAEAGLLTGFAVDYPWQGSRSKRFLAAADVVSPPVAAAVIGATLGLDWQPAVRDYLADIYPPAPDPWTVSEAYGADVQPSLFAAVA